MKRRLSIAISLIGDPDVVFLDEDQFENYQRSEKALKNLVSNSSKAEMQDFDGEIDPTDFNISE